LVWAREILKEAQTEVKIVPVCGHQVLGRVKGQVGSLIMTDLLASVLTSIVIDRICLSWGTQAKSHLDLVLKTFLTKARSPIVVQAADQAALVHLDLERIQSLVSHQLLKLLLVVQNQVHIHQESGNHAEEVVEDPQGLGPAQEAVHQVFGHQDAQETVKVSRAPRPDQELVHQVHDHAMAEKLEDRQDHHPARVQEINLEDVHPRNLITGDESRQQKGQVLVAGLTNQVRLQTVDSLLRHLIKVN
jgi:hypothetical protein